MKQTYASTHPSQCLKLMVSSLILPGQTAGTINSESLNPHGVHTEALWMWTSCPVSREVLSECRAASQLYWLFRAPLRQWHTFVPYKHCPAQTHEPPHQQFQPKLFLHFEILIMYSIKICFKQHRTCTHRISLSVLHWLN